MADLELTEEEKKAPSYLDWSDETLAKAVRALATNIENAMGDVSLGAVAAANVLINLAHKTNGAKITLEQEGCTFKDEQLGDWIVTVRRVRK